MALENENEILIQETSYALIFCLMILLFTSVETLFDSVNWDYCSKSSSQMDGMQ